MTTNTDNARQQAENMLEHIRQLVARLDSFASFDDAKDDARREIEELPLSIEVRGGWVAPDVFYGNRPKVQPVPVEYRILLAWGGPAVRIVGELDAYGEPETARIEYQDWGTPWTELPTHGPDALHTFASQFYYAG